MCASGRIVYYLNAMQADRRHNVFFTGYQAARTRGAGMQMCYRLGSYVELEGESCIIRPCVENLSSYSAHADQQDLLEFISGMVQRAGLIRIVHGDIVAKKALAKDLLACRELLADSPAL